MLGLVYLNNWEGSRMNNIYSVIVSDLETLLNNHYELVLQVRNFYQPFAFGQFDDKHLKQLIIVQPEAKIYARIRYLLCRPTRKYVFFDYAAKNDRYPLGRISYSSRGDEFACCDISKYQLLDNGMALVYNWGSSGQLESVEFHPLEKSWFICRDKRDICSMETSLGIDFPWQVDNAQKAQEILNISGYKDFFQMLVDQTPCEICEKVLAEHTAQSDHKYSPALCLAQTKCLTCGKCYANHVVCDHNFVYSFPKNPAANLARLSQSSDW